MRKYNPRGSGFSCRFKVLYGPAAPRPGAHGARPLGKGLPGGRAVPGEVALPAGPVVKHHPGGIGHAGIEIPVRGPDTDCAPRTPPPSPPPPRVRMPETPPTPPPPPPPSADSRRRRAVRRRGECEGDQQSRISGWPTRAAGQPGACVNGEMFRNQWDS